MSAALQPPDKLGIYRQGHHGRRKAVFKQSPQNTDGAGAL